MDDELEDDDDEESDSGGEEIKGRPKRKLLQRKAQGITEKKFKNSKESVFALE